MRLKADENMPSSVISLLSAAGHDVATVVEERLGGADDAAVIAAATSEQRAFVTLDKDFADIRTYPPDTAAGIVVLRGRNQTVSGLLRLVERLLPVLDAEKLSGRLWIVGDRSVRIR